MASVAVRLWLPRNIRIEHVIEIVNNALHSIQMAPPFTDSLQHIIDTMCPHGSSDLQAHCFRLCFPRGPVISTERLPLTRHLRLDVSFRPTNLEITHLASQRPRTFRSDTIVRDIVPPSLEILSRIFSGSPYFFSASFARYSHNNLSL